MSTVIKDKFKVIDGGKSDDYSNHSGGGGGGMESRVAKLESDVEHIKTSIIDIKNDMRIVTSDIGSLKTEAALIAQKMDNHFENQRQSANRIQWMVGIAIALAALVPAYFGMVKSEPPQQQVYQSQSQQLAIPEPQQALSPKQ